MFGTRIPFFFPSKRNVHFTYNPFSLNLLKSFSSLGAKIWNSIPQELRKVPKVVFKANLQNRLLEALMKEDDYVGIRLSKLKKFKIIIQSSFI